MADESGAPDEGEPRGHRVPRSLARGFAVGVALLSPVLIGLVIYALIPPETPSFSDPSTLEAVFASRFTITVVRIAILFGGVYAVVSVIALISRGQWLSGVGPFKVSESVRTLEQDQESLAQELDDAVATIEWLDGLLAETQSELAAAEARLASLTAPPPEEPE